MTDNPASKRRRQDGNRLSREWRSDGSDSHPPVPPGPVLTATAAVPQMSGQSSVDSSGTRSTAGQIRWQDPLGDISLSGFSDVLNDSSGNMNDVMEFVKRQASNASSATQGSSNGGNDHYFQFILMAPTSPAVPVNLDALTYLNQGQSYEVKCKKLGSENPTRLYRSVVAVSFFDRRHKFNEQALLQEWRLAHPGGKLVDVDIPYCVNAYQIKVDSVGSAVEFLWQPCKSTSICIKINCISTEFTPKKHGGEKGVPFRLAVDTFLHEPETPLEKTVHSCFAQIRVFKTKGADRKNKTDAEKAKNRLERERYQPAYDYTILSETFPSGAGEFRQAAEPARSKSGSVQDSGPDEDAEETLSNSDRGASPASSASKDAAGSLKTSESLPSIASPSEVANWLRLNRFTQHLAAFNVFSGMDLCRLTKEDMTRICGVADGIRLFNLLHIPAKTLFLRKRATLVYTPIYLRCSTVEEFLDKIAELCDISKDQIKLPVVFQNPSADHIRITDEFLQQTEEKAKFDVELDKELCENEETEAKSFKVMIICNP